MEAIIPEKKKRGRKAKEKTVEETLIEKIPKKRGRKPKGGKIISTQPIIDQQEPSKVNIILHLKCNTNNIKDNINNSKTGISNFQFSDNKTTELNYMIYNTKQEVINAMENKTKLLAHDDVKKYNYTNDTNSNDTNSNAINSNAINSNDTNSNAINSNDTNSNDTNSNTINSNTINSNAINSNAINSNENENIKTIWNKLKNLSNNLHINNISNKKCACFHCTCDFDNVPIYIPKYELNQTYHVYGCFCSPECACAYLMNDKTIDTTSRFERYQLLNYIYCKIYNYTKNIKPAPCPYYMLDKFYGNLSIQEYRKLLKNERLLLIVEKPLIRILPELHEDGDDYLLNYQENTSSGLNKYSIQKNIKPKSKNDILNGQFNIN